MRNTFNVVRSVGLLFFGIGILLDSFTLPTFVRWLDYPGATREIEMLVLVMLLGLCCTIVGLAGILKFKWFPIGGLITLLFGFLYGNWLFYDFLTNERVDKEAYLIIALAIITFWGFMISMILLMRNEHFIKALNNEDASLKEERDILDDWRE